MNSNSAEFCACGSEKSYQECCGRFIEQQAIAETPEQLMRSRYTAFTQANMKYLAATMKGPAAGAFNLREAKRWAQAVTWERLDVQQSRLLSETEGVVSFTAHFREQGVAHSMQEDSLFKKINGQWYYVDSYRE